MYLLATAEIKVNDFCKHVKHNFEDVPGIKVTATPEKFDTKGSIPDETVLTRSSESLLTAARIWGGLSFHGYSWMIPFSFVIELKIHN